MKIALGCDHAGLELKPAVIRVIEELGMEYIDFGSNDPNDRTDDYPVYAARAARCVARGEADRGIVLCGTGVGVGITANKVKGIRCVVCSEPYSAKMSRRHNDANMLAMGARVLGRELASDIARAFLETEFEGGRHARRVEMIAKVENGGEIE